MKIQLLKQNMAAHIGILLMVLIGLSGTAMADNSSSDAEPPPGTEIVHPADQAIMVWVPSGSFTMGMDADDAKALAKTLGFKDYHAIAAEEWFPKHEVYVDGFFIDKFETSYELWNRYTNAAHYHPRIAKGPREASNGLLDLYPVTSVTWAEAQQYANWNGKQLPTESQWEKAARGTDGRRYPWGNEAPTPDRGNFPGASTGTWTRMVGTFPAGASPYGCMDMSGNVYEWTADWLEPYPNNPEFKRMVGYCGHQNGVLRGGSFYHAMHALGCAKRFGLHPEETYYHIGFRTVWIPPPGYFKSNAYRRDTNAVPVRLRVLDELRKKSPAYPPHWSG